MKNRSWNSSYAVGIRLIDQQRENLFNIYDQISEMSKADGKYSDQEMKDILHDLESYIHNHFVSEEEILKSGGYDNIESHMEEHQFFVRKTEEFVIAYKSDNPLLIHRMLEFLKKWVVSHIMQTDSVYRKSE